VKPLDLAYAYTVLANGGLMRGEAPATPHAAGERELDPIAVLKVTRNDGSVIFDTATIRGERRVVPEDQTYLINSILTDPQSECLTFGCGGLSVPGYTVAVKTGTSEPYDPNGPDAGKIGETWAFGYTPDVVVGIWAGNADNAPITNILSTSIAYQAMKDVVLSYYGGRPATPFSQPPGVVRARICYTSPAHVCVEDFLPRSSLAGNASGVSDTSPPPPPVAAAPSTNSGPKPAPVSQPSAPAPPPPAAVQAPPAPAQPPAAPMPARIASPSAQQASQPAKNNKKH
jgi:membrane peptidoglycan carboxypeptidase